MQQLLPDDTGLPIAEQSDNRAPYAALESDIGGVRNLTRNCLREYLDYSQNLAADVGILASVLRRGIDHSPWTRG